MIKRSSAATEGQVQGLEIYLTVWINSDGTFRIFKNFSLPDNMADSVLKLDYRYTPWPRVDGNLLWQ